MCFFAIQKKGDNLFDFLFASLANLILPNYCLPLNEKICSHRRKCFPLRVKPIKREGKHENDRAAPRKSVPIHLKNSCTV